MKSCFSALITSVFSLKKLLSVFYDYLTNGKINVSGRMCAERGRLLILIHVSARYCITRSCTDYILLYVGY